jgi:hypothetical protein
MKNSKNVEFISNCCSTSVVYKSDDIGMCNSCKEMCSIIVLDGDNEYSYEEYQNL